MFGRLVAAAALLLPAACERAPQEPRVTVEHVVVTVPAVPSAPGAAYFTLRSNNPTRLVSVSSPSAARIEFHQTREENGMSRMVALEPRQLSFSAGEPLEFAPGGNHAMLLDVDPNLRPGGQVTLTFTFEGAPPVSVNAPLVAPGTSHGGH